MTTEEKLVSMLVKDGLFEKQAKEVITLAKPKVEKYNGNYKMTWNSPSRDYPEVLYTLWYNSVIKKVALEWIEKNVPQAWYRPIFEI